MTLYKLTIEYDGTNYAGWQRQPDHPSVQEEIEKAIYGFCQQKVKLLVAGRTDAGVHALGQVAQVELAAFSKPMEPFEIAKAINAHLRPQPISILTVAEVAEDFHARFDAKSKLYRYKILNRPSPATVDKKRVWHVKRPLDAKAMHEAAQILLGHHDFSTFRDSDCQAKHPMRTLDRLDVTQHGEEIHFEAEAQSFIHHQVRNMVGTLALVGEGKWTKDDLARAFEAKDRTQGGPTAPADGLYMVRIDYD